MDYYVFSDHYEYFNEIQSSVNFNEILDRLMDSNERFLVKKILIKNYISGKALRVKHMIIPIIFCQGVILLIEGFKLGFGKNIIKMEN